VIISTAQFRTLAVSINARSLAACAVAENNFFAGYPFAMSTKPLPAPSPLSRHIVKQKLKYVRSVGDAMKPDETDAYFLNRHDYWSAEATKVQLQPRNEYFSHFCSDATPVQDESCRFFSS
jgi:hypothetical protein